MKQVILSLVFLGACVSANACGGDDDDDGAAGSSAKGGGAGKAGGAGRGGASGRAGTGGSDGGTSAGSSGKGGAGARGGEGGTPGASGEGGEVGNAEGGLGGEGGSGGESVQAGAAGEANGGAAGAGETSCTGARDTLLGPIDAVSSGAVSVLDDSGGVKVLYVDASAGGYTMAASNPWTYVRLSDGTRVDVTDPGADGSTAWDLAFKRDVIRVNGGDGGPGNGAVGLLENVDFGSVDAQAAAAAALVPDEFLDAECEATVDETGKPVTGFSTWYDYDLETMVLTPNPIVFVVRAAEGSATYKLELEGYYSTPEGGDGATSARYRLHYAAL